MDHNHQKSSSIKETDSLTENVKKDLFPCEACGRVLKSKSAKTNHLNNFCKIKDSQKQKDESDANEAPALQKITEKLTSQETDDSPTEPNQPKPDSSPKCQIFYWGTVEGEKFSKDLDFVYEKIVHWRQNLFLLPTGKSGKKFIREMTRLINSWVDNNALKPIAFKAIMVMPALLLQKPSRSSKAKDHAEALSRRLELWDKGNLHDLIHEGTTIQDQLETSKKTKSTEEISKAFV